MDPSSTRPNPDSSPPLWTLPLNTSPEPEILAKVPRGLSPPSAAGREKGFRVSGRPDLGVQRAPLPSRVQTLTCVPLPAPGGPSSTARMPLGYSGSAAGALGAMSAKASRSHPPAHLTGPVLPGQCAAHATHTSLALTLAGRHVRQISPARPRARRTLQFTNSVAILMTTASYWTE